MLENKYRAIESAVIHKEPDESLLYNDSDGKISILNPTASRVFELCDGSKTVSEIITIIKNEFESPSKSVGTDIQEFITMLEQRGVIVKI